MSEWYVRVVRLDTIERHPNADFLSIAYIGGRLGYPVIFRTEQFRQGDLAVFVPVDSVVPDTEEWAFLKGHLRIRASRLRGIFSMGVLIPIKSVEWREGDDVHKHLGITKYEPPLKGQHRGGPGGNLGVNHYLEKSPPPAIVEYTDIEGLRRYPNVLVEGEEVVLVEKIHGANMRVCFTDGRLWVGSHHRIPRKPQPYEPETRVKLWSKIVWGAARVANVFHSHRLDPAANKWRERAMAKPAPKNVWWDTAIDLDLEEKLSDYPGLLVYGEVYGSVQDLHYGFGEGKTHFRVFDMMDTTARKYLDYDEMELLAKKIGLETAPLLYRGPWSQELRRHAEGNSTLPGANHVREGFVVRPVKERVEPHVGRVIFKLVGEGYLLRNDKKAA
jgi:RNA ligase (TIGR02306 family)